MPTKYPECPHRTNYANTILLFCKKMKIFFSLPGLDLQQITPRKISNFRTKTAIPPPLWRHIKMNNKQRQLKTNCHTRCRGWPPCLPFVLYGGTSDSAHRLTPSDCATPYLGTGLCEGGIGQAKLGRGAFIKQSPPQAVSIIFPFAFSLFTYFYINPVNPV